MIITAGIYARVSTKQKAKCPQCGKTVRVADARLIAHDARSGGVCSGSGDPALDNDGQDTENQLVQQRRYAEAQGWTIIEFIDRQTGKHANRAAFQKLFEAASRREINMVLVWALDRFTREGVTETFLHIRQLLNYGCQFESLTEPHFRTTGPAGELMIAIAAWIAKQERVRISDRTKAGLDAARAKGKQLGRRWKVFPRDRAEQMRKEGVSWRGIARELGVGQSTIRSALNSVHQTSPKRTRKKEANKSVF
jgi:DNA invertase Pin-like site-specific DNA recombinase